MSLEAMTLVWKYSKQSGSLLLLELALADYADEKNVAWPSITTLATKIRMSRRYTVNMLKNLERSQEIKVIQSGDFTHSNHYQLMIVPTGKHGSEAEFTSEPEFTSEAGDTTLVNPASLGSEPRLTRVVRRASKGSEAGMPITTKNHQLTPNESLNQPPPQKAVAAVVDGKWNLAGLLDLGRVYKKRRESIPADADPALYVGNYLYAITQKGFSKPPSFWAASRLSEGKLAGDVFNELADLPPERLALILRWSADPFGIALVDELLEIGIGWRSSWQKGVDADKVRQAIAELGLSEFIPAAAPEPSTGETTDLDRWLELVGKFQNNPGLFMHLSGSKFINANGAVRIEVADERIKQVLDRSWPIIGPKLKRSFPEKELIVEVRK